MKHKELKFKTINLEKHKAVAIKFRSETFLISLMKSEIFFIRQMP